MEHLFTEMRFMSVRDWITLNRNESMPNYKYSIQMRKRVKLNNRLQIWTKAKVLTKFKKKPVGRPNAKKEMIRYQDIPLCETVVKELARDDYNQVS